MRILSKARTIRKSYGKAFTLVELMTVIFIISVLMLLSVPVLRGIRNMATESKCKSNLKEFGVALNQFLSDYGGAFPGSGVGASHFKGDGSGDIQLNYVLQDGQTDLRSPGFEDIGVTQRFYNAGDYKKGGQSVGVDHFIQGYIGADTEATFCPTAELEVFNYDSPIFKGEIFSETYGWRGESKISGYAMNSRLLNGYKEDFGGQTIAFIERHVHVSWGLTITPDTYPSWGIRNYFGNRSPLWKFNMARNQGDSPPTKPAVGERIDVAFNHRNGACYVAVDGRVAWISSNDIAVRDDNYNYSESAAKLWGLPENP